MNSTKNKVLDAVAGAHSGAVAFITNPPQFATKYQHEAYTQRFIQSDLFLRSYTCAARRSAERAELLLEMTAWVKTLPFQVW